MTDKEIIKYLEQAIDKYNKNEIFVDNMRLDKLSLELIKQKQAEIKKLKIENQSLRMAANSYKIHYNEAVKEFAEKLKDDWWHNAYYSEDVNVLDWIDNLVKETAGDTK